MVRIIAEEIQGRGKDMVKIIAGFLLSLAITLPFVLKFGSLLATGWWLWWRGGW